MSLSHETEPAGIGALRQGTVSTLANGGVNLITVAQCLDTDAYEFVGGYGTRDNTWFCGGTWNPPTNPPGGGCAINYTSVAGDTCTSIGSSVRSYFLAYFYFILESSDMGITYITVRTQRERYPNCQ